MAKDSGDIAPCPNQQGGRSRPTRAAPRGMKHQPTPIERLPTRIGVAAVLPDVLRDLGVDPQAVFEAADVDIVGFGDPDALIPAPDIARLFQLSGQASGRSDLGLRIVERAGLPAVGLLGRLVNNAGDLRSALLDVIRY